MGEAREYVVLIKGKLTGKQLDMLSDLVHSFGHMEMDAHSSIVEVGVKIEDRIVRCPVGKFFNHLRWGLFEAKADA